ncbi:hypothetical protein HAX54_022975 [Datura stramonium]|uniref:Uncharacterized protein n=1 Tax=Datura stramonium TaxID=4076 RepID=A0ABS8UXF8_DATST|nr:hypothetical protein [Datura stramonium]
MEKPLHLDMSTINKSWPRCAKVQNNGLGESFGRQSIQKDKENSPLRKWKEKVEKENETEKDFMFEEKLQIKVLYIIHQEYTRQQHIINNKDGLLDNQHHSTPNDNSNSDRAIATVRLIDKTIELEIQEIGEVKIGSSQTVSNQGRIEVNDVVLVATYPQLMESIVGFNEEMSIIIRKPTQDPIIMIRKKSSNMALHDIFFHNGVYLKITNKKDGDGVGKEADLENSII